MLTWDAFKAVARGRLIDWNSVEKIKQNEKHTQIQNEIIKIETELEKETR